MAHYPTLPLEESARRANHVAGVSVQTMGTQTSYPFRRDLPADLFWEQQASNNSWRKQLVFLNWQYNILIKCAACEESEHEQYIIDVRNILI